jgi:hypothetical protein
MAPGYVPNEQFLQRVAQDALQGVGSKALGEWHEWTGTYYHIRRRLSKDEQKKVGDMLDVRGTDEGVRRAEAMQQYLPAHMRGRIE